MKSAAQTHLFLFDLITVFNENIIEHWKHLNSLNDSSNLFFCHLLNFLLQNNLYKKIHHTIRVSNRLAPDKISVMTWVQTVSNGNQQMTKVITSNEKVIEKLPIRQNKKYLCLGNLPKFTGDT